MDHLYKEYNFNFDVDLLKQEVLKVIGDNPITGARQKWWWLQHNTKTPGDWVSHGHCGYNPNGDIVEEDNREGTDWYWNPELENSYIKECVNKIHSNPAAVRIMLLDEGDCYPTHCDAFKNRYQIPVFTIPPLDYFVFPKDEVVISMKPGKAYWLNTHTLHSTTNGTAAPRINILFIDADDVVDTTPQENEEFRKYREMIKANKEAIDAVYNNR